MSLFCALTTSPHGQSIIKMKKPQGIKEVPTPSGGIGDESHKYTHLLKQSSHASDHKADAIRLKLPLVELSCFGSDINTAQGMENKISVWSKDVSY